MLQNQQSMIISPAESSGLIGMELQGAMAIITVNLKRILKLME